MSKIAEWRKAIAAAVLGVPAWGVVAQVDGIEPVEWWGLAGVLATALVVWLVPNSEAGPFELDDRGQTTNRLVLVLLCVALFLFILWLLGVPVRIGN